ncbi:MAG: metallophosphatase family protein [Bifidobacteriaceae bacterium]|nr:metallophosphatase family protein [Bifidobacteriaceae bacterium]
MAVHGSPRSDTEYLLETVEPVGARRATPREIADRLGGDANAESVLCGHTHLPRVFQVENGPLVVNPGSAGRPVPADRRTGGPADPAVRADWAIGIVGNSRRGPIRAHRPRAGRQTQAPLTRP